MASNGIKMGWFRPQIIPQLNQDFVLNPVVTGDSKVPQASSTAPWNRWDPLRVSLGGVETDEFRGDSFQEPPFFDAFGGLTWP